MGKKARKIALEAKEAEERARHEEERARFERVLEIIERAFDGVPPPDEEHLTLRQAEAWDSYRRVDQAQDHKGRWQDLPEIHIRECRNAIPHLDNQGIQFYLPALMSYILRTPNRTLVSLLYTLQPATGELKLYQRRRFSLLTAPQREAILAFLENVDDPEADSQPWRRAVEAGNDPEWFRKFY